MAGFLREDPSCKCYIQLGCDLRYLAPTWHCGATSTYSSNEVHYLQYYKKDKSKLLKKKFEDKNDTKYYYIIMNLVSSESDESDDNGAEDIDHECCRGGLYVAQTRLNDTDGRRRDFLGLFTRRKIKRGEFIGFYTGEWYTERAYNRLRARQRTQRDEYAISSSSGLILSPPIGRYRRPTINSFSQLCFTGEAV